MTKKLSCGHKESDLDEGCWPCTIDWIIGKLPKELGKGSKGAITAFDLGYNTCLKETTKKLRKLT